MGNCQAAATAVEISSTGVVAANARVPSHPGPASALELDWGSPLRQPGIGLRSTGRGLGTFPN
ncbi:BQ5605_C005g03282 [Microbotryum silenes-dioicae]|uniref:BQ5605_C005g03282 protein n=1 Tax=Microbotryum silenes-dioicae TaxID=796604 RepID=A0A2X0MAC9_9BASI|nr:BQ5605_C005g03282 [Microbotryum silenes-dioicae]